jgi:hypothetical protein
MALLNEPREKAAAITLNFQFVNFSRNIAEEAVSIALMLA